MVKRQSGDFGRLFGAQKSIPTKVLVGQSDCRIALLLHNQDGAVQRWNLLIPRLNISILSTTMKGVLLGALVQLGYRSPTEDKEEAILGFVKGCGVFVSLSTMVNRCVNASLLFFLTTRSST